MRETCETERMVKWSNCGYYSVRTFYFFRVISVLTGLIGVIPEHGIIRRLVVKFMSVFEGH